MPQSLSQVYLHSVWSTKNRTPMIHSEVEQPLYAYMWGIIKNLGGTYQEEVIEFLKEYEAEYDEKYLWY